MSEDIKIFDIVKHSSKFSGVALFTKILGFPKSIILAMVLMPEDYGKIGIIMLYMSYLSFFNLGNVNAAFREMPGLLKQGNDDKATYIQNNAFSFDLIIKTILLLGLVLYAFLQNNIETRLLLGLSALWFYFSKIRSYQNIQNLSRMDFGFAAKINLIIAVISFIFAVSLVYLIGIYALVVPLLISELVAIVYQYIKKGNLGFTFQLSKKEIIRTTRIGIPLIILSFLYKAFESITSKTLIVKYLTEVDLGLFVFALSIVFLGTKLIKDISNVYRPMLWSNADTVEDLKDAFKSVAIITPLIGLIGGVLIGLVQIGFIVMVNVLTVNFINAQWVFLILSLCIFSNGVQAPSEFVLTSNRINKQIYTTIIWLFALLINISLSIVFIHWGYGIVGVAMALVISQILASYTIMIFASRYFLAEERIQETLTKFFKFSIPLFISIIITVFHWVMIQKYSIIELTYKSLVVQFLLWFVYIFVVYRDHVTTLLNRIITRKK